MGKEEFMKNNFLVDSERQALGLVSLLGTDKNMRVFIASYVCAWIFSTWACVLLYTGKQCFCPHPPAELLISVTFGGTFISSCAQLKGFKELRFRI